MPDNYAGWRATKLHYSNYSESTLYMGYTVIALAIVGVAGVFFKRNRRLKLSELSYPHIIFATILAFLACFLVSLPDTVRVFGHGFTTPTELIVRFTANWRTISRLFLAMDPLVILVAALGLYVLTCRLSKRLQVTIVAVCGVVLFFEYLPSPLNQVLQWC